MRMRSNLEARDLVEEPDRDDECDAGHEKGGPDELSAERDGHDACKQRVEREECGAAVAGRISVVGDVLVPKRVPPLPHREDLAPRLAPPDDEVLPVTVHVAGAG